MTLREARGFRSRLLGLAFRAEPDRDEALVFPRCRSVHTFGMRFPIDVVFVDHSWNELRVARSLSPRRVAGCRGAYAAIEVAAGEADRLLDTLSRMRARAGGTTAPTAPGPPSR
jgi:uncharacterized protein